MKFEDFMTAYLGDTGIFQVLILCIAWLNAFTGNETFAHNFIGGEQEHWCLVPELQDVPHAQQKYIAIPYDSEGLYDSCSFFNMSYDGYSVTDYYYWNRTVHETSNTVPCEDWVYDQSEYLNTLTSELDLVCENAWKVSFMSTMSLLGYLVGGLTCGVVSDKIGRVPTLCIFAIIRVAANFISSYAPNYAVFITCRFFIGIGVYATYLVSYIYVAEVCGKNRRTLLTNLLNLSDTVGLMIAPIYAFFIRDHFYLQQFYNYATLFLIFGFIFFPESPRWLLVNKKWNRAEKSMQKIAAINGKVYPKHIDVRSIEIEQIEENVSAKTKSRSPWKTFVRSGKAMLRLAVICATWFTCSLMYYSMTLNVGSFSGNIYLNSFLLNLVDIPAIFLANVFMSWPRSGRRWTMGVSLLFASAFSFLTIPFIAIDADNWATAMSLIGKSGVTLSYVCIYLFTCELMPTEIRNGALGIASASSRISGMISPFIGGPLADFWPPLPMILFGSTSLVMGILTIWLLPETLGKKLLDTVEELIASFRKPDVSDGKSLCIDDIALDNNDIKIYVGANMHGKEFKGSNYLMETNTNNIKLNSPKNDNVLDDDERL